MNIGKCFAVMFSFFLPRYPIFFAGFLLPKTLISSHSFVWVFFGNAFKSSQIQQLFFKNMFFFLVFLFFLRIRTTEYQRFTYHPLPPTRTIGLPSIHGSPQLPETPRTSGSHEPFFGDLGLVGVGLGFRWGDAGNGGWFGEGNRHGI